MCIWAEGASLKAPEHLRSVPARVLVFVWFDFSSSLGVGCCSTPTDMSKQLRRCSRREQVKSQRKAGGAEQCEGGSQSNGGIGGVVLGYRHAVLFWFVLAVYFYTAMPSVPGGDAGELLASGCQLGIPHPPGEHAGTTLFLVLQSRALSSA